MAAMLGTQRLGVTSSSFCGSRLSLQCRPVKAAPFGVQPTVAGLIGPGKRWEHYELNKNHNVVRKPMHVKKGDTVQVIAGSDKGKVGEIEKVIPKTGQIVVKGINIKTRHVKPKVQGESGQITESESPVHHSNVMLYSTEKQVRSRIGYKVTEDGKKVRYLKKTGEIID
ncbi:hypothetical protein WJX72_003920 [[Myrmecia] bisecta]|uniref:KOW domain-containing protein n=1 Tax=[Myrmecia] bisecta TaxID=41462 RepID=A0AAW1PG20_9CHLO